MFHAGGFWAEGETCAWRVLPSELAKRRRRGKPGPRELVRSRTCGAGLLLDPIKDADPTEHALSPRTQWRLLGQLQGRVRLVDSGDATFICLGQLSENPPYEVQVRIHAVIKSEPLANVRPRLVPPALGPSELGHEPGVQLSLGRITVATCAAGVVSTGGWEWRDGTFWNGMSARRLSFLP